MVKNLLYMSISYFVWPRLMRQNNVLKLKKKKWLKTMIFKAKKLGQNCNRLIYPNWMADQKSKANFAISSKN